MMRYLIYPPLTLVFISCFNISIACPKANPILSAPSALTANTNSHPDTAPDGDGIFAAITHNKITRSYIENLSTDYIHSLDTHVKEILTACIEHRLPDEITQDLILKFFQEHQSLNDAQKNIFNYLCSRKAPLTVLEFSLKYEKPLAHEISADTIFSHRHPKEILQLLIDNDVKLNTSLFHCACSHKVPLEVLELLLKHGTILTNENSGHLIFSHPHPKEILLLLVENDVKLNPGVFHFACWKQMPLDVLELLLKHGIILTGGVSDSLIFSHPHPKEVLQLLIDNDVKLNTNLFHCACLNQMPLDVLELLLKHGTILTDEISDSLIFFHRQAKEVLPLLVQYDVKLNTSAFNGACSRRMPLDVLELLLKHVLKHGKLLTDEISGDAIFSHPHPKEVLLLLAQKGVKLHNFWLAMPIRHRKIDMIDLLIELGVNVNDNSDYYIDSRFLSLTPLQYACTFHQQAPREDNIKVIRKLIAAGTDIKYKELLYAWQQFPQAYQALLMSRRLNLETCTDQETLEDFYRSGYDYYFSPAVSVLFRSYKEQGNLPEPVVEDLKKVATCKAKMQQLYTLIFSPEVSERIASDALAIQGTFFSLAEIKKEIEEEIEEKERDNKDRIPYQAIDALDNRGRMDLKNSFLVNALHYFYIHLSTASTETCPQEVNRVHQLLGNIKDKDLLTPAQYEICQDFYTALAQDKRENKNCYLDAYLEKCISSR